MHGYAGRMLRVDRCLTLFYCVPDRHVNPERASFKVSQFTGYPATAALQARNVRRILRGRGHDHFQNHSDRNKPEGPARRAL